MTSILRLSSGSSDTRTQMLLQSATFGGYTIPREMISGCTYVEYGGFSGPQIRIDVLDRTGKLVNELGLKFGSILDVKLGDPDGIGGLYFSEKFYVLKAPREGDKVTILAFSDPVRLLKVPAPKARYFTEKQPGDVVSALTSLPVNTDAFVKTGTFHLDVGQKPSDLLQEMGRHTGSMCWVSRTEANFKSFDRLMSSSPTLTYEASNPNTRGLTISRYKVVNADYQFKRAHNYRVTAYDQKKGLIYSGPSDMPLKMLSYADETVLANYNKFIIPRFDMVVEGNCALTPGTVVKVLVHNQGDQGGFDESVPAKMIVINVSHQEDRYRYTSRALLGVVAS